MRPKDTGKAYDQITHLWEREKFNRANGIEQHKKALTFVENKGKALDVGCGSTGRLIDLLLSSGLQPEGVDISAEMLKLAREKHPEITFHHQDICEWEIPAEYDFITAWDSIWHIPLDQQEQVLTKLISCLKPKGVMIFSFGGTDEAGHHTNDFMGPTVYYSSLGVNRFVKLVIDLNCVCRHLEYEKYPDLHTYLIVQKP